MVTMKDYGFFVPLTAKGKTIIIEVIVSKLQKGKDKWKLVKLKENGTIKHESRAVLVGLRDLQLEFEADVIDAEKGIVDVYWLRRMENADERDMLVDERSELLQDLDDRFRVVRENLE